MNGLKLTLKNITKQYPFVTALDDVCVTFEPGKIYGILGENGAGKSTLMKVIAGVVLADCGTILVDGNEQHSYDSMCAKQLGISMVHQHFTLVDEMSVVDNILLANEEKSLFLRRRQADVHIKRMEEAYGLKVNVNAKVSSLSLGEKQRVEIIKALYKECRLLILDEPTAVLTPAESKGLFEMLRKVSASGTTVLLISHKLDELLDVCDQMIVMRGGKIVTADETKVFDKKTLSALMVGEKQEEFDGKYSATKIEVEVQNILSVDNLSSKDNTGKTIEDINFQIGSGEVYGIAGVDGNGQSLLIESLMGLVSKKTGLVMIDSVDVTKTSAKEILSLGVAYIPEDSQTMGIVPDMTVEENLILNQYHNSKFGKCWLDNKIIRKFGIQRIAEGDIRVFDGKQFAGTLSGGNQQKLVAIRELEKDAKLFVLVHPTRGMDMVSAKRIRDKIIKKKQEGAAILLVSSDLDEVLALSDRVGVMYEGRLVDGFSPSDREKIGWAMAVGKESEI